MRILIRITKHDVKTKWLYLPSLKAKEILALKSKGYQVELKLQGGM